MTDKQLLRQQIRSLRHHCDACESAVITDLLRVEPHFRSAHTLLLYSALPDEVATQPLIDELAAAGKTVLLPRVTGAASMELRRYTGRGDLCPGAFGIMEPPGTVFTDSAAIDVAAVPGMAFDRHGHRLGRGRGYYDRFLSAVPSVYKIGVCFPWQLVDDVPVDDHDILMDKVITAGYPK